MLKTVDNSVDCVYKKTHLPVRKLYVKRIITTHFSK